MGVRLRNRQEARKDIARFLSNETIQSEWHQPYEALSTRVLESLAVPESLDTARLRVVVAALVFEAACGPESPVRKDSGDVWFPLAAAREVLLLAGPYSGDPKAVIPSAGISIEQAAKRAGEPVDLRRLPVRRTLAAVAGGVKGRHGLLPDHTNLLPADNRLGEVVVTALSDGIDAYLSQDGWLDRLEGRIATLKKPLAFAGAVEISVDPLSDVWSAMVADLDRAPGYYPPHFRPSTLYRSLSVRRIEPSEDSSRHNTDELYTDERVTGELAADEIPTNERRVIILGDPGSGKSTIATGRLVQTLMAGGAGALVRLPTFGSRFASSRGRGYARITDALLASVLPLDVEIDNMEVGALEKALRDPDFFLVLDGLDEIESDYAETLRALRALDQAFPGSIWLTSRVTGYEAPFVAGTYRVGRFEHSQRFFDSWHPLGSVGRQNLEASLGSPRITALSENPLLAGFIAFVAESDTPPTTVNDLYARCIERLVARHWKHDRRYAEAEGVRLRSAARRLAWQMATRQAQSEFDVDRWRDVVTAEEAHQDLFDVPSSDVDELLSRVGLLVRHGDGGFSLEKSGRWEVGRYRWLHRTIHEHLVGQHLADLYDRNRDEALPFLENAILRPRTWSLALVHMIESMDATQSRDLLEHLLSLLLRFPGASELLGAFARLASHASDYNLRADLAGVLASRHEWEAVVQIGEDVAEPLVARLPDDLFMTAETLEGVLRGLSSSPAVIDRLFRLMEASEAEKFTADGAHLMLIEEHPVRALHLAIRYIEETGSMRPFLPTTTPSIGADQMRALMKSAKLHFTRMDFRRWFAFLQLVAGFPGGKELIDGEGQADPAIAAFQAVFRGDDQEPLTPKEAQLISSMLRGDLGEGMIRAFEELSWIDFEPFIEGPLEPWSEVAIYKRRLAAFVGGRAGPQLSSDASDAELAPDRFAAVLEFSQLAANEQLAFLRSLHACVTRPSVESLEKVLLLWRAGHPDWTPEEGNLPFYGWLRAICLDSVGHIATQLGWQDAWPVLRPRPDEVVRLRAGTFLSPAPVVALMVILMKVRDPALLRARTAEVVRWFAAERVPILWYIRTRGLDPQEVMIEFANDSDWLRLKGNVGWLAGRLAEQGTLPHWRVHLEARSAD